MKKLIISIFSFGIAIGNIAFAQNGTGIPNDNISSGISSTSTTINVNSGMVASASNNFLDPRNIYISSDIIQKMYFTTTGQTQIHDYIRKYLISQMVNNSFSGFETQPIFGSSSIYLHYPKDKKSQMSYDVVSNIKSNDKLDSYIYTFMDKYKNYTTEQKFDPANFDNFILLHDQYKLRKDIYLYKTNKDLKDLGYILTSYRTRTNKDSSYRRFNIKTAFYYFGNVRILNPGETIYYMNEINYDPRAMKNYMSGDSIVDGEEIPTYGGGLCGSSTAIYQGILSNKGLSIKSRSHSKWRNSLYAATIDGYYISTPGLDSTIYSSKYDFVITNTTKYPIIIVSNFDGKKGSQEQNFTIGKSTNIGNYYKPKKNSETAVKKTSKGRYKCYNRIINGKTKSSCYKEINNKDV